MHMHALMRKGTKKRVTLYTSKIQLKSANKKNIILISREKKKH